MDTKMATKHEMNRRFLQKSPSNLRGRVKSKWERAGDLALPSRHRRLLSLIDEKDDRDFEISREGDTWHPDATDDDPEGRSHRVIQGMSQRTSESRREARRNRVLEFSGVPEKTPNHSHAWKGVWERPMKIDEDLHHPFTIARMTNHKVRCCDGPPRSSVTEAWATDGTSMPRGALAPRCETDHAGTDRMENEGGRSYLGRNCNGLR